MSTKKVTVSPKKQDQELTLGSSIAGLLAKNLKIPVYFDDGKLTKFLVDLIKNEFPEKAKHFSESKLNREIADFTISAKLNFKPKSKDTNKKLAETLAKFIDNLDKPKKYIAYVFIPDILDFPLNQNFGSIKTISKSNVAFKDDKHFWEHAKMIQSKYKGVDFDKGLWLKCQFESLSIIEVREDFRLYLQPFIGLLSFLMFGFPITQDVLIGVILGSKRQFYLSPGFDNFLTKGWAKYAKSINDESLNIIKDFYGKKDKTELENKIVLSSKMFFLANQVNLPEAKFLSYISALESLLLGKDDRDYLRLRISEKVAFLLQDSKDKRLETFHQMKKLYDRRSALIHGAASQVEEDDVRKIEHIFQAVFRKVLELSEKYPNLRGGDEKGLDDYINNLKFS